MAWESSVPLVLDALVATFTGAPELEGVTLMDGPAITSKAATRVLSVGWTAVEGEVGVETQILSEGLGGRRDREQLTVRCTAAVISGSTDVKPVRDAAYEILSAAGAVLDRTRQLDGTTMRVQMGSHQLMQEQTKQGAQALLVFEINSDGYSRR